VDENLDELLSGPLPAGGRATARVIVRARRCVLGHAEVFESLMFTARREIVITTLPRADRLCRMRCATAYRGVA
jgi:hypothetical protein